MGTLVSVARSASSTISVSTTISPALVSKTSRPVPRRSARATEVAIVACPQKSTSAEGAKYRTRKVRLSSSRPVTKAVSEYPTSAATASISASESSPASRTIPAGFPPSGSWVKAVYRRISTVFVTIPGT